MTIRNTKSVRRSTPRNNSNNTFYRDVINGLKSKQKKLQSKYFYDKEGDRLFQQIMQMPEYYLTLCEMDIFMNRTRDLANIATAPGGAFDLIELGAGDATKTKHLLKYLTDEQADFTYLPIDISGNILSVLNQTLSKELPKLDIVSLEGDYFDMLEKATHRSSRRKVLLFLGGNIGNMEKDEAAVFCNSLREKLSPDDIVIMGFDLKKHPHTILDAYNDKAGITAAFNMNLLNRMNRELEADFDMKHFEHYQTYDPLTGACRSFLVSLKQQQVAIKDTVIPFNKDETIYMEVSQKYSLQDIDALALQSGFEPVKAITDSKKWFNDAVWQAV